MPKFKLTWWISSGHEEEAEIEADTLEDAEDEAYDRCLRLAEVCMNIDVEEIEEKKQ